MMTIDLVSETDPNALGADSLTTVTRDDERSVRDIASTTDLLSPPIIQEISGRGVNVTGTLPSGTTQESETTVVEGGEDEDALFGLEDDDENTAVADNEDLSQADQSSLGSKQVEDLPHTHEPLFSWETTLVGYR